MKNYPRTLPAFIVYFVKRQKFKFILLICCSFGWVVDSTVWPYAFKLMIDTFVKHSANKTHIWSIIVPVLCFWLFIWVLVELFFRAQGFLLAFLFPRFQADIRMEMFDYVSHHSFNYFANNFAGNLSNKISDMSQNVSQILQMIITLFFPVLIAVVIAVTMFFFVSSYFGFMVLIWILIHMSICFIGGRKCTQYSDEHATSRSKLMGKIVDSFTNIINVKSYARHKFEYQYIDQYQHDERLKNKKALIIVEKVKVLLGLVSIVFPGIFLTLLLVYTWQLNIISTGDAVLIFTLNSNLVMMAWYSGLELPRFFNVLGICQQAFQIIKAKHEIVEVEDPAILQVSKGEIKFDHVTFYYHKKQVVFKDLSVTIKAGEKIGLVGFSGGGKSSFVNLIIRFFDVASGRITIDGQNIAKVSLQSLRDNLAVIQQDPTLFHRTIRDNIIYGVDGASENDMLNVSKLAYCDEFIQQLPQKYEALVGERGVKLSGGQRQRIAIARAMLKNAPILILDEATSALDSITEKHIQQGLNNLMKNKTTIVIAHRLSTLVEMDRLMVFHHGEIIEQGSHEELLQQNGHYAMLWRMQAGGFLPDSPEVEK